MTQKPRKPQAKPEYNSKFLNDAISLKNCTIRMPLVAVKCLNDAVKNSNKDEEVVVERVRKVVITEKRKDEKDRTIWIQACSNGVMVTSPDEFEKTVTVLK